MDTVAVGVACLLPMITIASDLQVKVSYLQVTALSRMKFFSLKSAINKGVHEILGSERVSNDCDS